MLAGDMPVYRQRSVARDLVGTVGPALRADPGGRPPVPLFGSYRLDGESPVTQKSPRQPGPRLDPEGGQRVELAVEVLLARTHPRVPVHLRHERAHPSLESPDR